MSQAEPFFNCRGVEYHTWILKSSVITKTMAVFKKQIERMHVKSSFSGKLEGPKVNGQWTKKRTSQKIRRLFGFDTPMM